VIRFHHQYQVISTTSEKYLEGDATYIGKLNRINSNDNNLAKDISLKQNLRFIKLPQATFQWQEVKRKIKRRVSTRRSVNPKDIKYFKCFSLGHFKAQCMNLIKCFKCQELGHVQYKCLNKDSTGLPFRSKQSFKTQIQLNQNQTTKMENNFFDKRPAKMIVYFERRDHLNQHSHYLNCAGLITLRGGQADPSMIRPIQIVIAHKMGWNPIDYEVYSLHLMEKLISSYYAQVSAIETMWCKVDLTEYRERMSSLMCKRGPCNLA
jgi:Zinc knuckle